MSLLELEHVSKRYGRGPGERVALHDVSLRIDAGELVTVWGMRRSGRSTLLRVAAGVENPDEGLVRFAGQDLADRGAVVRAGGIGYCYTSFRPSEGKVVLDQILVSLLTRGESPARARSRARAALERAGVAQCATREPDELDGAEAARAVIARAIAGEPRLLVIDEPTKGVDQLERDAILLLLRSLADDGIAVLSSTATTTGFLGADRGLTIGDGELLGEQHGPELAPVVPLRRSAGWQASL
jgi:predicted ABC-type transport system involved in lysophospholipase L1 biosynthesis ATPase subunit